MESTQLPVTSRTFFSRFSSTCTTPRSPEERRAVTRFRRLTSTALIIFIAFSQLAETMKVGPARTAIAVLAGIAFCTEVYASGMLLWSTSDEFRRHLLARSFFVATVITFLFVTLWGYAEIFSKGALPRLPLLMFPVLLIFLTAAAKVIIFRQHRAPRD